jgi:UDP-2,3-diacylglucosamine hydrolase
LLMHGDTLCIDDPNYQRLRRIVRNPLVQFIMRRLTLRQRLNLAARMRAGSKAHIASMDQAAPQIMDVNQDEVRRRFEQQRIDYIVHGHTHRPAIHKVQIHNRTVTRIVLGDWYEQGSVLRWDKKGFELAGLDREVRPAGQSGNETAHPAM